MKAEEIFKLAQEAGASYFADKNSLVVHGKYGSGDGVEFVQKFAILLIKTERERCANECRKLMPKEGVIRNTLLDLENSILNPNNEVRGAL